MEASDLVVDKTYMVDGRANGYFEPAIFAGSFVKRWNGEVWTEHVFVTEVLESFSVKNLAQVLTVDEFEKYEPPLTPMEEAGLDFAIKWALEQDGVLPPEPPEKAN
jgi:hypothetical protein